MRRDVAVKVEFLTRVEGHGHIVVNVRDGVVERAELQIVEAPRFFEAILRGRSIFEAQHITSRICGICACGHSLASIQAAEHALGFSPSAQTVLLRTLLLHMELLDSHVLHINLLVAPDLLGVQSFIGMMKENPEAVRRALRMKQACNTVCDLLVGRHVHPISCVIGGFTKLPTTTQLVTMRDQLVQLRDDLLPTVELIRTLSFPEFCRETEYVALCSDDDVYPLLSGAIASSDGVRKAKEDYRSITNEFLVQHSSAKHARLSRNSYAVGALARFNLNAAKLHPSAQAVAAELGLRAPCCNPYLNTVAQLVECVHCSEEALMIVEQLLAEGIDQGEAVSGGGNENQRIPVRAGRGIGAVEVPRGILFHDYTIDDKGMIEHANCVIPTGQNLQNIEDDMHRLVPEILVRSDAEITLALEMLVRAYDPCISCSTHFLKIDFVGR
ncbi:MAG: Ni/Fe hydrogenase subunit alpha [Desulfuromonadales bacterium]|nr:Ni/Fe hydrogenase subunit alpha [Desulfuromonadales bacterium]MDT8424193.1 Ni/Fe hydrogenase subunit alpha [Desulfuromonadales bacterium]